jgi:hypothetical protein
MKGKEDRDQKYSKKPKYNRSLQVHEILKKVPISQLKDYGFVTLPSI